MATPFDFSQLAGIGSTGDAIRKQIEMATALRNRPAFRSSTWGGQAAGSIGDVLREVSGGIREGQLAEALAANRNAEQAQLGGFNTALQGVAKDPDALDQLAIGAIASGHPALTKTGTAVLERARAKEREAALAKDREIDNARQAFLAMDLATQRQWLRDNPEQAFLLGRGNEWVQVPRRTAGGQPQPASPVVTADGAPVVKPDELSDSETTKLEDLSETIRNATHLEETFKPEYAGVGGKVNSLIGEKLGDVGLGDLASDAAKAATAWWSEYDQFLKLPERLRVSGQSLTASEERAFDRASRARKGGDARLIMEAVQDMREIAARKQAARAKSAAARGVAPGVIDPLLETPPPPPIDTQTRVREPPAASVPRRAAPPPTAVRMRAPDGQMYEIDPSEVAEAIKNKWQRL